MLEVVVDEEPEEAVVGAGQLAQPDGERLGRQRLLRGRPLGGPLRVGQVEQVLGLELEPELGAHHGDRAPDQAGDVLAAQPGERVDRPQRGVDRPQRRAAARTPADGAGPLRSFTSAATSPVANQPSGSWPPASPNCGPASGGPGRPGAISHTTRPPIGSCDSSPTGLPGPSNSSSDSSRWSGSRKPATGLTVPAGSTWSIRASAGSTPPPASTRRNIHRAGRGSRGRRRRVAGRAVDLVADRHRGRRRPRAGRASARTCRAASPSSPGSCRRRAAGAGPTGAGGTKSPVVGAGALEAVVGRPRPSSWSRMPSSVAVTRSSCSTALGQRGQRRLDVVGHVTDAAGRLLQRILGGEEVPHRGGHRAGRAGREQRSAGGRGRRRGDGDVGVGLEVDGVEPPARAWCRSGRAPPPTRARSAPTAGTTP